MKRQLHRPLLIVIKVTFFLILTFYINSVIQTDLFERDAPSFLRRSRGWNQRRDQDSFRPISDIPKVRVKRISNPLNILLWTTPQILQMRRERLEKIRDDMNYLDCFEGCRMSVGGTQFQADDADAILFFMFNIGYRRNEFPQRKNLNQIWIYHQLEPPRYFSPGAHLNHLFNWTMTYRQDSDIYQPYSKKVPLNTTSEVPYFGNHVNLQDWINGKKYLATAVVSKCKSASKREKILKKLKDTGIPIHVYGGCANQTICKRYGKNCTNFWKDIASKYKFFLAFENSLCSDYITEKFWRSLNLGMVPIVFGKGSYLEVAPPNSYIDIRNFSTLEELKDYLHKLDKDPEEYSKYFEWKKHFVIKHEERDFCDVCRKLKEHRGKWVDMDGVGANDSKVYDDLTRWWSSEPGHPGKPACLHPEAMGMEAFLK